jgi:hypothetical protein
MRDVSNARGSDHAGVLHFNAGQAQTAGKDRGDPAAGFACVLADDHAAGTGGKVVSKGASHGKDRFPVERIFSGNAANSVSPKKFSQFVTCTFLPQRAGEIG